ncbi:MAG: IS3 family transposase [Verrucomicrobiota bacterium]
MVGPSAQRRAVQHVIDKGMAKCAVACRALGLATSTFYWRSDESQERKAIREQIIELSHAHPRYGYWRIAALMRRAGYQINVKRVQRVRREAGIKVPRKQRRTRRVGISTAERRQARRPNEVWSWDFVSDQTATGNCFRILTLIDEFTREFLAAYVSVSIRAEDVIRVVGQVMKERGTPEHIRSDNGPEFVAHAIQDWMKNSEVSSIYIKPGSPWEQAWIESFHDKLRDELLNRELFRTVREAQVVIDGWRCEYNEKRPHSSLGYQPPKEFAARFGTPFRATPSTASQSDKPPDENLVELSY